MSEPGYGYVFGQRLAIGSAPPPGSPLRFDLLVLTAMEYQPPADTFPGLHLLYVPLDDADIPATDIDRARRAGCVCADFVRKHKRVLVTCYQGRNRSGLVTAFALKELGYTTRAAVSTIRAVRGSDALSNPWFVRALNRSIP